MINVDKLRGRLAEKRITQTQLAELLGVSMPTMTTRMRTGNFWTNEIEQIAEILEIEHPGVFFYPKTPVQR